MSVDERIAAWLSDEDLDILWRRVLRRPITERERADAEERLASGVSRSALLESVVASAEFRHIRRIDDAVARGLLGGRPRTIEQPADAPEAAVEIAWCLGRVSAEERVLDVGYAFAERAYLAALAVLDADVTAVDLVVVDIPGVASVQADLRALPFDDDEFDVAIGISTLQVVGRDNSRYGLAPEDNDTIEHALVELRRVAKRVLVSVPTGERRLTATEAVYEPSEWVDRFSRAGLVVVEDELYEHTPVGWRSVEELTPPARRALLCAELARGSFADRLRLALRDRRHRGEVRRVTR